MNNPTASSSRTSSTPAASSTLRPRTARLISGLDDETSSIGTSTAGASTSVRVASPRDSPFGSRSGSPAIPSRYPSRTSPADRPRTAGPQNKNNASGSSGSLLGSFGGSWSALQGLASNVLGSDAGSNGIAAGKRKAEPTTIHRRTASSSPAPSNWGISSSTASIIAAGSKEDHISKVREAKRKDMLRANGQIYPDTVGNFKRRTSDDASFPGVVGMATEEHGDALVYVHQVHASDTIAGVAVKYNCQASIIRKANRMWLNDPIQVRRTIVLPVDACGIKGRPCSSPTVQEEVDILGDETEALSMYESPSAVSSTSARNGWHQSSDQENTRPPEAASSVSSSAEEPPWKHDSWVMLPGFPAPTEIARLPRRDLGFFPRARRKSNTYSDIGTPKTSFDIPRTASSPASTPKAVPSPRPSFNSKRPSFTSRGRSNSQSLASLLQGPGGVGTLDRTTRIPGPAPDSLNRILGPHLPNVEPPPYQTVYTPWLTPSDDSLDDLISFNNYRQKGIAGGGSTGMEWQDVGGAIEKWIRKTARKAATALETSSNNAKGKNVAMQAMSTGTGEGDLIELVDSFEIGEGNEDSDNLLHMGANSVGSSGLALSGEARDGIRGRSRGRSSSKGSKID